LTYGAGAIFVGGWAEELEPDARRIIRVTATALMTWARLLIAFLLMEVLPISGMT
jgi:hypothetical protein